MNGMRDVESKNVCVENNKRKSSLKRLSVIATYPQMSLSQQ